MVWAEWLEATADTVLHERHEQNKKAARGFGRREAYAYSEEARAAIEPGRQRLIAFEACRKRLLTRLAMPVEKNGHGVQLSPEQVELFNYMRDTSLLKMYGGSIEKYLRDLSYIRNVCPSAQELYTSVAVILPRRSGKTMVQALVATCIVLSMPKGNVLTYNLTWPQAKTWFTTAYSYMKLLKDDVDFGWKLEHIENGRAVRITKTGSIGGGNAQQTGILVYGNAKDGRNAQNLRGTGGDAIIAQLDEGLFFADEAYIVILPVLAQGAGFVITSSQPPLNTNAMGLLEARDKEGNPVMRVISMRRQCCACEHREKRTQQEVTCQHVAQRPLAFRSRTDEERLEAYMKPFGENAYATEMLNRRAADTSRPFFDAAAVTDAFAEDSLHRIDHLARPMHWVLLSMDPAGSEHGQSETSLISMGYARVLPGRDRIGSNAQSIPPPPPIPDSVTSPTEMYAVVWPLLPPGQCPPRGGSIHQGGGCSAACAAERPSATGSVRALSSPPRP